MDFKIENTWDGFPVRHEPVCIRLSPGDKGMKVEVSAPFFNDPPAPLGEPGKPFSELWNYEVVEAFFLNDTTEQYLEVELCPIKGRFLIPNEDIISNSQPLAMERLVFFSGISVGIQTTLNGSPHAQQHGQHLVLLLSGRRNIWKKELELSFKVFRGETNWEGIAFLPWSYFPPNVTKFNSFAIHGSNDRRSYEALYPVPQHELQQGQKPDFHRLEYFKPFSLNMLLGEEWKQPEPDMWLMERPDM